VSVSLQRLLDILSDILEPVGLTPYEAPRIDLGFPSREVRRVAVVFQPEPHRLATIVRGNFDALVCYTSFPDDPSIGMPFGERTAEIAGILAETGTALVSCGAALEASYLSSQLLLFDAIQLVDSLPVETEEIIDSEQMKLVVFTPVGHEAAMVDAIARAGGARIGLYSHCAFYTPGTGTYTPEPGAKPWRGEVGRPAQAEEVRVEARVPRELASYALELVHQVHPYEKVAFDLYPLVGLAPVPYVQVASGRLKREVKLLTVANRVRRHLMAERSAVRVEGQKGATSKRVAICALRLEEMPVRALIASGCDTVVAGLLSNTALDAFQREHIGVVQVAPVPLARATMREFSECLTDDEEIKEAEVYVEWFGDETEVGA